MRLELITFKFCPFGQRCLILLFEKGVDFDTTFIDLKKPPEWFDDLSPLGKVPVLRVDDKALFDSTVINEFIDEVFPPPLAPGDLLERAWQRSLMAFAGELLPCQLAVYSADSEEKHREKLEEMNHLLHLLAGLTGDGPFFGGDRFAPIDAAYAPFFLRVDVLSARYPHLGSVPEALRPWSDALLKRSSVRRSTPARFADGYRRFLQGKGSWLLGEKG